MADVTIVNNNQDFSQSSGLNFGSTMNELYHRMIDNTFVEFAENITLHLPPSRSPCTDSQCRYDPHAGRATRYCATCKGTGFIVTTRDTVYKAHIAIGPTPFDDDGPAGRLEDNEARVTVVKEAYEHIRKAEALTVRGEKYQLKSGPKLVGFSAPLYLICVLERLNEGGAR